VNNAIIITTINALTRAVKAFALQKDWITILIGDKKSRSVDSGSGVRFLSIADQLNLDCEFARVCPFNHYSRKNIGYLYAIENGAKIIYDTDDDNIPYSDWHAPEFESTRLLRNGEKYLNVYKYFTNEHIWPRGFPLDEILATATSFDVVDVSGRKIGVWQGLADDDPDVDAIYRLTVSKPVKFAKKEPVHISEGTYVPFNSQNTFWSSEAFPLLYLPVTVSFRFTDILRGYVAQRVLWEHGLSLGFTSATVYQERNAHDFMKDFSDEIDCYLQIKKIVRILDETSLNGGMQHKLLCLYEALVEQGIVSRQELVYLESWIKDFNKMQPKGVL